MKEYMLIPYIYYANILVGHLKLIRYLIHLKNTNNLGFILH